MLQTSLYAHIWIVPRGLSKPSAYRCVCRCSTKQPALNKTLLYVIRWLLLRFLHCCSSLQQNHMTAERQTRGGGEGGVQTDSKRSGEKEKRLPETERAGQRRKKRWNWKCSILSAVEQQQETVVVTKTNPVPQLSLEMKRITGNKQQLSKFNPIRADILTWILSFSPDNPVCVICATTTARFLLTPLTVNILKSISRQHKQKGFLCSLAGFSWINSFRRFNELWLACVS